MMFGIITEKRLKKELDIVSKNNERLERRLDLLDKAIIDTIGRTAELKGMIAQLNILREQALEGSQTPPTSPQTTQTSETPTTPITIYHKKAKRFADKVQILAEIKKLIERNLTTTEMYNIVVNEKNLCKKSCFFKYLKIIKQSLQTSQTPQNKTKVNKRLKPELNLD